MFAEAASASALLESQRTANALVYAAIRDALIAAAIGRPVDRDL